MTGGARDGEAIAPGRHGLVSIAADDWPRVARSASCAGTLDGDAVALVADWGRRGLPVITRRRTAADDPGALPVGLPLPPALGKLRVALRVPMDVSWRRRAPLTLGAAQPEAPPSWQPTIAAVLALATRLRLVPCVFGALLWQTLTGLPYLHARSDLDLLWPDVDAARLPALLDGLAAAERTAPLRLDGEILCAAGGVSWRELAGGGDPHRAVLVKGADAVRLAPVRHLFAGA